MEIIFDKVSKSYKQRPVLKDISFRIKEGESIGIMGESGAGKSTLTKLLMGVEAIDKGDIFLGDLSYRSMKGKEKRQIYKNMQLVVQNSLGAVNPNFSVEEVLLESLYIHYGKKISKEAKSTLIKKNIQMVGLGGIDLGQPATSLSGGQLQRLCIARALMLNPKVLILDESLSGLDPMIQKKIIDMLLDLKEKIGLSYIVVAHDYRTCYYLCDRVMLIEKGKIVGEKRVIRT